MFGLPWCLTTISGRSPSYPDHLNILRRNISLQCGDGEQGKGRVLKQSLRDSVTVDLSQSVQSSRSIHVSGSTSEECDINIGLEGSFVLPASRVEELKKEFGVNTDDLLRALITPASELARPPISSFHVGAAGIGGSGALYVGCNLEFAKLPLYNSVHAEQFLLVNALHHGETEIKKLAISAAPCGHCRQFFSELACADSIKFLFFGGSYSLGQLLPMRFKPGDLLDITETPLLLQPQCHKVAFSEESKRQIQQWEHNGEMQLVEAAYEALKECKNAYSPYSGCPAGAAILTTEGGVYAGGYIESAAYNPSMLPLQSAIIDAVIDGMPCYSEMKAAILVEVEGGPVQHRKTMEVNVAQIAPQAQFHCLSVKKVME